jgi:hypothetical protein
MASFLVTPGMPPALAKRVMASVRGKSRAGAPRIARPRISMAAMIPISALLTVAGLMLFSHWMSSRELGQARGELLEKIAIQRASLPADYASFLPMTETWVARIAGNYEGDLIADELRKEGALHAQLLRPALFVRDTQPRLARADQLMDASAGSVKDAVLLCLGDPPDSRAEKAVTQKIKGANFAAVFPSMHRFYDAEAGLSLLGPSWEAAVRAAPDVKVVHNLNSVWMRAPLDDGRKAASAELLLVVVDELPEMEPKADPSDGRRPEERPHAMRLALVDLRAQSVLLRLRRTQDSSSYPPAVRFSLARAITGCLMAMDVRDAVAKGP